MIEIDEKEAEAHLFELLHEVAKGSEFMIMRHGRPVALLQRIDDSATRHFDSMRPDSPERGD